MLRVSLNHHYVDADIRQVTKLMVITTRMTRLKRKRTRYKRIVRRTDNSWHSIPNKWRPWCGKRGKKAHTRSVVTILREQAALNIREVGQESPGMEIFIGGLCRVFDFVLAFETIDYWLNVSI